MPGLQVIQVKLGHHDQTKARLVGIEREQWYKNNKPLHKTKYVKMSVNDNIETQIMSVAAEIAVARYFNLHSFQPRNGTFKDEADVGENVEVRYTELQCGDLIIRPRDRNTDYAVLVTGSFTKLYLMGWHDVATAKRQAYVKDYAPGCWWVPQSELLPMNQLHMIEEVAYASKDGVQAM